MLFTGSLAGDPASLAVVMAGLALVLSFIGVLHYWLERKSLTSRITRLESALRAAGGAGQTEPEDQDAAAGENISAGQSALFVSEEALQEDDDTLPAGIRFV